MDMFSMEAKRIKEAAAAPGSYFEGKWDALVKETPNGDATVPVRFEKKDGNWKGYFTEPGSTTEKDMASVKLDGENLVFEFSIAGYDVSVTLTKKDDNTATGRLMSMFDVIATRKK
jgi:cytochrome c